MQDGTYFMQDGHYLPVTPDYGYFVAVQEDTRVADKAPFVGVWTSPEGQHMEEPSTWLLSLELATQRGLAHQQYSIWDCTNGREIKLNV